MLKRLILAVATAALAGTLFVVLGDGTPDTSLGNVVFQ